MNDCILHKRVSLNSSPAPFMPSNRWSQPLCIPVHVYEVRPRKDHRGHDLISDALPFGRLWYTEIPHAIGYAKFYRRSRVVTHSLRIGAEQKAATMRLRPGDCENHRSEQAHCHRVAGIQWPHHRGMDICVPKRTAQRWSVARRPASDHPVPRYP